MLKTLFREAGHRMAGAKLKTQRFRRRRKPSNVRTGTPKYRPNRHRQNGARSKNGLFNRPYTEWSLVLPSKTPAIEADLNV
jgi:hypothetical protein